MRKSKSEAAETRQKIIQIASELFRVKGIAATGIAEIMETAGLTNGGFYKHFDSKDQLVQEALKVATGKVEDRFSDSEALIRTYLSPEHIKGLEWGCPIVGIGSELSRTDEETRIVATEGIKQLISFLEKRIEAPVEERRKIALVSLSIMVGGATLSKIVDDNKLAKEILDSAKKMAIELTTKI